MNMKKTVAGLAAGVVALSAMASTVSAVNELTYTKDQAAFNKTWDFTSTKFPITWTGSAQAVATPYLVADAAPAAGDLLTFVTDTDVESLSLTIEGQAANTTAVTSKTFAAKKGANARTWTLEFATTANIEAGQFNLAGFANDGTNYQVSMVKLTYTFKDSKQKKNDADDAAGKEKTVIVTSMTATDTVAANGTALLSAIINDVDGTPAVGQATLKAVKGTVGTAEVVHGVTFQGLNAGSYKNSAGTYQAAVTKQDTIYYFGTAANGGNDARADGLVVGGNVKSYKEETISAATFATADLAKADAVANAARNDVVDVKWNNMIKEIQTLIGDAKGAKLVFGVYSATTTDSGRGNDSFTDNTNAPIISGASAQDFSFAINTASSAKYYSAANMADSKITLSWDEITNGLAAGTGLDAAVRIAAGKKFVIDSVSIDVPAKSLADLSAGESVADTAASIAAPTATESAAATEAAKNPTTGNAPIALAVIPVAIIAAAVIAKKRG